MRETTHIYWKKQQRARGAARQRGYTARDERAKVNPRITRRDAKEDVVDGLNWIVENCTGKFELIAAVSAVGEKRASEGFLLDGKLCSNLTGGSRSMTVEFDAELEDLQVTIWFTDDASADHFQAEWRVQ